MWLNTSVQVLQVPASCLDIHDSQKILLLKLPKTVFFMAIIRKERFPELIKSNLY